MVGRPMHVSEADALAFFLRSFSSIQTKQINFNHPIIEVLETEQAKYANASQQRSLLWYLYIWTGRTL